MSYLKQLRESVRETIRMMAAFNRASRYDEMTEALERAREKQAVQDEEEEPEDSNA